MDPISMLHLSALLLAGAASGFLNVVAGGGSLITVPLLIFLGVPETTANGTSRLAIFVQCIPALLTYRRAGQLDMPLLRRLGPPALAGALLGALVGARLPDAGFRSLLGAVMLACAVLVVLKPPSPARSVEPRLSAARVVPLLFAIGVYGGLLQASVGYLILAALTFGLALSLQAANVMKTVLVALYTPLAISVFAVHGRLDLPTGAVLCVGSAFGGWLGAKEALRRGERFIRIVLALVVLASGVKLLLD
jgi:uncharacterized membrane protein YfcA